MPWALLSNEVQYILDVNGWCTVESTVVYSVNCGAILHFVTSIIYKVCLVQFFICLCLYAPYFNV